MKHPMFVAWLMHDSRLGCDGFYWCCISRGPIMEGRHTVTEESRIMPSDGTGRCVRLNDPLGILD